MTGRATSVSVKPVATARRAVSGSPNTSYVQYTYVGSGVTTRTWTVTMPMTPGTYEFRLFPTNGYTLAATSPPIGVTP